MNTEEPWKKRTGYAMADRQVGYRGVKFSTKCFQRQLRDSYSVNSKYGLENLEIREITFRQSQEFILKYEWLGTMGTTKFSYGVFHEDVLLGVACFGLTAGTGALSEPFGEEHKSKGIVLVRGACAAEAHPHTGSYLIGQCKKRLLDKGYSFVIAYSDPEAGEIGTLYQATNWKFYGFTSPVKYLVRPDGKRVDPKLIHKYAKKYGISSQQQKQNFLDEGYTFETGSRKLKYLLMLGKSNNIKQLLAKAKVV